MCVVRELQRQWTRGGQGLLQGEERYSVAVRPGFQPFASHRGQRAADQDESLASYAAKIRTADALLDWSLSAEEIGRSVRAYNPAPGAWFMLGDERVKCWRATVADTTVDATGAAAGTVLSADHEGIVIACGRGAISLTTLQRPGKSPVSAREFAATTELRGRSRA